MHVVALNLRSRELSSRAKSLWDNLISLNRSKARRISILTCTARLLYDAFLLLKSASRLEFITSPL